MGCRRLGPFFKDHLLVIFKVTWKKERQEAEETVKTIAPVHTGDHEGLRYGRDSGYGHRDIVESNYEAE